MTWGIAAWTGTIPFDQKTPTPPAGAPPTNDAATDAWVAAVVTAGGTVSAGRTTAVNNFIVGLKADGLWTLIDRYWLYASEGSPQATLIDIKALGVCSAVNSPTLGSDGYVFNGSNQYLITDFNTSTAGGAYTLNNSHVSVWPRGVTGASWCHMGAGNATAQMDLTWGSVRWYVMMDDIAQTSTGFGGTDDLVVMQRTGSTVRSLYTAGVHRYTDAQVSISLTNLFIYVGALNYAGGPTHFDNGKITAVSIGASMDATQNTNFRNRCRTLMTACGVP